MYLIMEALRDDAEMFGFVDGRLEVPAYQWAKPKSKKARMCKIQGVAQPMEMAMIEVHDFSDDVCIINGVDRRPRSGASGIFSSSRSFTASNGRTYKWKTDTMGWALLDQSASPPHLPPYPINVGYHGEPAPMPLPPTDPSCVATYHGNALRVYSSGYQILDEIVGTAFYVQWKSGHDKSGAKAFGEVGSAVGDAGGAVAAT